jgi:hypothetical protein
LVLTLPAFCGYFWFVAILGWEEKNFSP